MKEKITSRFYFIKVVFSFIVMCVKVSYIRLSGSYPERETMFPLISNIVYNNMSNLEFEDLWFVLDLYLEQGIACYYK
jgi:hypothetical protein